MRPSTWASVRMATSTATTASSHMVAVRWRESREQKARRGQGQGWGGLVMERASFSLGRQAPARRRTLIPSNLMRGTPRAEASRSFYIQYSLCCVALPRTMYLAPTADPPRSPMPQRSLQQVPHVRHFFRESGVRTLVPVSPTGDTTRMSPVATWYRL